MTTRSEGTAAPSRTASGGRKATSAGELPPLEAGRPEKRGESKLERWTAARGSVAEPSRWVSIPERGAAAAAAAG
eukprot:19777-Chlamydomonas_euryale.AAC.1